MWLQAPSGVGENFPRGPWAWRVLRNLSLKISTPTSLFPQTVLPENVPIVKLQYGFSFLTAFVSTAKKKKIVLKKWITLMISKSFCKAGCFNALFSTKLMQNLTEFSAHRSLKIIFDDWSLCSIWHRTPFPFLYINLCWQDFQSL